MIFTSEDLKTKVLHLKNDDRIKIGNDIYEIQGISVINVLTRKFFYISHLIDKDFEILKNRVGNKKCSDFKNCEECPLNDINCRTFFINENRTLYTILNKSIKNDTDLYQLIMKRLEQEVK